MSYPLDQPIRLTFNTFSDAAETVPADPTTVSLSILLPDGTTTTVTLAGAQVVRDSLGVFHYDYTPPTAGFYSYRWVATGAVATSETGSFEVAAAFDPGIVTLTDARAGLIFLNPAAASTDDGELQEFIDAATDVVENIVGPIGNIQYTETHDGGVPTVALDRYPVITISTVTEYDSSGTGTALASEPLGSTYTDLGYRPDLAIGVLTRTSGGAVTNFGTQIVVAYTAGRASVPPAVRQGTLELIRHMWETQRGGGSTGLPSLDPDLQGGLPTGAAYAIPNRVTELLAPYRKAPKT